MKDKQNRAKAVKARLTDATFVAELLGLGEGSFAQSDGIMIRCPFHDDKKASMSLKEHPDGVGIRCFACGAKGDIFHLIAKIHGLDVKADFKKVLAHAEELAKGISTPTSPTTPMPRANAAAVHTAIQVLLAECPLDGNPDAVAYLQQRGFLGPAQAAGVAALPPIEKRQVILEKLGEHGVLLGLVNKNGHPKHPNHELIVPWSGNDGLLVTVQRRVIGATAETRYVFPPGIGATDPYGSDALSSDSRPIAIVEGAFDTLAMRMLCAQASIQRDVIGLPGTTWKPEWVKLLTGRVVILAHDADAAGDNAARDLAARLREKGITDLRRRKPKKGADWASMLEVHA